MGYASSIKCSKQGGGRSADALLNKNVKGDFKMTEKVKETKETKVLDMEQKRADKIDKMQQFLTDNKIDCFDVQKLRMSVIPQFSVAVWK